MTMKRVLSLCWVPMVMTACATEMEAEPSTEPAAGLFEWPPENCPEGCGDNAASVGDKLAFHRLDASGSEPNGIGLRLVGMKAQGMSLQVEVHGDELSGVSPSTRLSGGRLVGAEIYLERDGITHTIVITNVRRIPYWVGGGETWAYRLAYRPLAYPDMLEPLCTTREEALHTDDGWEGWNLTDAVIFTGDHYDAIAKTVSPQIGRWFNIACAGSAMAKLHLLRHSEAGSDPVHRTNLDERQAMFKMITADVCGTGRPFTRDGERLYYMDRHEWTKFDLASARSLEAIWTRNGAACLDEPRRLAEEGSDLLYLIADECQRAGHPLPPCTGLTGAWNQVGYAITGNQ